MKELSKTVETKQVYAICECGGNLKYKSCSQVVDKNSRVVTVFLHVCEKCGNEEWLKQDYPTIKYIEIPE